VELELLLEPPLGERLGERADHAGGGREQDAVAALDRLQAKPDGEVRLSRTATSSIPNLHRGGAFSMP